MKLLRPLCAFALCGLVVNLPSRGQTVEQALSKASAAFSQGKPVASVTLTATAEWIAGSDKENGNATLTANADGSSSLQLQLEKGSRTEAQTSFASGQTCSFSGQDAVMHSSAGHNCMSSVAWFIPGVSLFGGKQPTSLSTVLTAENSSSQPFLHLRQQQTPSGDLDTSTKQFLLHLSTVDLYLDPTSSVLSILDYKIHPDKNAGADIPVQILFTDYQVVDGIRIPFRIQRYINGVLNLDLTVTQVSAN